MQHLMGMLCLLPSSPPARAPPLQALQRSTPSTGDWHGKGNLKRTTCSDAAVAAAARWCTTQPAAPSRSTVRGAMRAMT